MSDELSIVMIKPDAIQKGLAEEIEKMLNLRCLQVIKRKTIKADKKFIIDLWPKVVNYEGRLERSLIYLSQTILLIWVVKGSNAVIETIKVKEEIRKKYSDDDFYTLLHCPDSKQDFMREYKVLFPEDPLSELL